MLDTKEKRKLSSSESTSISLEAVRLGEAGLNKHRLVVHSHADYNMIKSSSDDREFLRYIGQKESLIVSYITGNVKNFTQSVFDDI